MKRLKEDSRSSFIFSAGWLFADMLLALAMVFLAANTFGIKPPPSPPKVEVTPKAPPRLEQSYHRFTINIDPQGLLNGSQSANDAAVRQVKSQSFLRGRSVGLIIVYGGAPDIAQIGMAQDIANRVYHILHNLGKHDDTFKNTSMYDPLYVLGNRANGVSIDIFLFAQ
jgi:hypothetical protein